MSKKKIIVESGYTKHYAKVDSEGILLVGLDGFTIEDLAEKYPFLNVGLHVKDGDKWVPIKLDQITVK